jgi:uncharacterized membrane protein
LTLLGLGIIAGTEFLYLRDFLAGGEWYRMNTLFKFTIPAWLMLSVASGIMLPQLWAGRPGPRGRMRLAWRAGVMILLAGGLVFLGPGVAARVKDRFPGARPALGTLDASAYMTVGEYTWPHADSRIVLADERAALSWLLTHVEGTPVIAEAPAGYYDLAGVGVGYDYYRAGGLRAASFTGLPTFVGQHQGEQRPGDQVGPRTELALEFFRTTDLVRGAALLETLRVGYVYVGRLERILFTADSLRKFEVWADEGLLERVYRNESVSIYAVRR